MIEVAKEAAIESGKITLSLQGKRHTFIGKEKLGDFTTEADITSEKKILRILQIFFSEVISASVVKSPSFSFPINVCLFPCKERVIFPDSIAASFATSIIMKQLYL